MNHGKNANTPKENTEETKKKEDNDCGLDSEAIKALHEECKENCYENKKGTEVCISVFYHSCF